MAFQEVLYEYEHFVTDSKRVQIQIKPGNGKMFLSFLKQNKWIQDGQFHNDKGITFELFDFKENILPALVEMVGKVNE